MDLYAENILDRYKNPLHKGEISGGTQGGQVAGALRPLGSVRRESDGAHFASDALNKKSIQEGRVLTVDEANPLCGDKVRISLLVGDDGKVLEAMFSGQGCAISQAASDMLMERITGMRLEEARGISNEEVYGMLGVPLSSARVKCALLALAGVRRMAG